MFWKTSTPIWNTGLENVVWYGRKYDKKRVVTQWVDPEFYRYWDDAMREAFDILGMMDRFQSFFNQDGNAYLDRITDFDHFVPVAGLQNRELLRKAISNINEVTTKWERLSIGDDVAIRYTGDKGEAFDQWRTITELLGQTTVMAIATPGLRYYVQGTQVGYSPKTRHLFRKGNTVERLGNPNEPFWRVNVSGYVITILGDWDEIKRVRRTTGYNLFQMLQLRLNEELEATIKKER